MAHFLELPFAVRRRIYCHAGLVTDGKIDVLCPTESRIRDRGDPWRWITIDATYSFPSGLFLTCRAIHSEASSLFFSTNQFIVRAKGQVDLAPLRSLVRSSRGQLKSLFVDLSVLPKPIQHIGRGGHFDSHGDEPLVSLTSSIVAEWLDTAVAIGTLVEPRLLGLSFVCNVADVETAELIAASIGRFNTLRSCNIRLSTRPDSQIQGIAKQAAVRAIGQASLPSSPFRLMCLPAELRLMILEYTDLVTPLKEVEWNPEAKYYLRYRTVDCNRPCEPWCPIETCPPTGDWVPESHVPCYQDLYHYACQFRQCWQDPYEHCCFCRRYHAAYSASSPGCNCWMPPRPLFLVNRQLYQESQSVFFQHNRIIVTPPEGLWPLSSWPPAELYPAAVFLRSALPPSSLRYLRFLDIIFAPVDQVPDSNDPAYLDWRQTLEWARDKLELPRLTLRVEIADYYGNALVPDSRRKPIGKTVYQICAGYMALMRPLEALVSHSPAITRNGLEGVGEVGAERDMGLYRLFAHLASPYTYAMHGSESTQRRLAEKWASFGLEKQVEQRVMGKEYDGVTQGKWSLKVGEWKWEIWYRHLEGEP